MAEETTPIYCTSPNDNALTASLLSNGMNGQWNNPFIYLVWMMFANRFFGNGVDGTSSVAVSDKLDALSNQMATNQNTNLMMDAINGNHEALHSLSAALGVDYTALSGAIAGVQSAITAVGGTVGMTGQQVINSVLLGNKDLTAALQSCCCENKMLGLQNTNSLMSQASTIASQAQLQASQIAFGTQAAIESTKQTVLSGFADVGYKSEANTNRIIESGHSDTQRIIDTLNNHWTSELSQALQTAKFENSQLKQNVYLGGLIQGTTTASSIW